MTDTGYDSTPEQLNQVWKKYAVDSNHALPYYMLEYNTVSRKGSLPKRFEDWLWSNGIRVIQRNHKRFMRFYSRDDAVMFMLKYA